MKHKDPSATTGRGMRGIDWVAHNEGRGARGLEEAQEESGVYMLVVSWTSTTRSEREPHLSVKPLGILEPWRLEIPETQNCLSNLSEF